MKNVLITICLSVGMLLSGCNSYVAFTGGDRNISVEYSSIYADEADGPMYTGGILFIDNPGAREYGTFVKFGYEVVPGTGFFATALGGLTFLREQRYGMPDHVNIDGMFGGGVTWFVNGGSTALVTSYDNKRGTSVGMGWRY